MTSLLLALVLSAPPTAAKAAELAKGKQWEELYLGFATAQPSSYGAADQKRIAGALSAGCVALVPDDAVMAFSLGEKSVAFDPTAEGLLCLARGAVKTEQRSAAEGALRKGSTRYPKDGRFNLELGRMLLDENDAKGAVAALTAVPKKSPQYADAQALLSKAKKLSGDAEPEKLAVTRAPKPGVVEPEGEGEGAPPDVPLPVAVRPGKEPPHGTGATYESSTDDEGRRVRANANFRFRYFSGQKDFGQRANYEGSVQAALEEARLASKKVLGVGRETPTDVILYSREEFAMHHGPQAAMAIAGFYSANAIRMNDSAEMTPRVQATLVHEYTHAIIDELASFNVRGLPVWVNEGLAEYTAWSYQGSDHAEIGQVVALRSLAQGDKLPPLNQMANGPLIGQRDPGVAYALAGSAVALLVKKGGMSDLLELIREVGKGAPFDKTFERHYGREVARFDEELRDELKSR